MSPLQQIERALCALGRDPKRDADGASGRARCPVPNHGKGNGDQDPSLTYGERDDGSVRIRCFAGCDFDAVLASLGLTRRDCYRDAGDQTDRRPRAVVTIRPRRIDPADHARMEAVAARYRAALTDARREELARSLGLTADSLLALDVGWDSYRRCWTFPMRDGDGRLVGFRFRRPDGSKFGFKGGHEGLFLPADLRAGERLVIAEGPTDTAAILGLGFNAVGRPSCEGGVQHLVRLVRRLHVADVVVAADRDPPGQRGAAKLADVLVLHAPVRVITPPAKDMREWISGGATAADVRSLIVRAPPLGLRVAAAGRRS